MTSLRILLLSFLAGGTFLFSAVPGDANGDGILNAADHAFIQAILSRRLEPTEAADVDGDGTVTAIDAAAVADLILGQTPFLAAGSGELPTTGGSFVAGDLGVSATAGALPTTAAIVVSAAQQESPYEGDDDSPLYRIEGIPTRHGTGVTFSLPPASAGRALGREGETLVEVGEMVALHSSAEPHLSTSLVVPRVEDGRLVIDLPVPHLPSETRAEEVPATRTVVVRRVTGIASDDDTLPEDGRRAGEVAVRIYRPAKMTKAQYQPVLDALGPAIIKLKSLGFSPSARANPVYVYLKKLGSGTCGYYVGSPTGVDNSYLEINLTYVTDASLLSELKRTVYHEYFHMVQSRFDPRFAFTQCKYNAPQLWFDDACSVWFEQFATGGTTSSYMDNNAHEVLAGHHMDCSGLAFLNEALKTKAQNHGYGLALMLQFLFAHPDAPTETLDKANPTLVNIYTAFGGGSTIRDAFLANVPTGPRWWDDMLLAFANGTIGNPGVAFGSSLTQPGAHATSITLTSASKSPESKTVNPPVLGDMESWAISVNWRELGAKAGRSLVMETASADNALRTMALNCARNQTNPLATDGTSFGQYGSSYVSWLATPMESTNKGLDIRPLHYLLLRHAGNAPAGGAAPIVRLWYVEKDMPVSTTAMKETWDAVAPKLIDYSLVGTATCEGAIQTHETKLYDSAALTNMVSRGGASYLFPSDGAYQMQINVQLTASIAPESVYRIKEYRVRTYYHDKAGEVREAYIATYASPGQTTNINLVATLGANDQHLFIDVSADEDFKPGATLDSGVPYSLRSWFSIGTMSRYEVILESRYGAKAGSRAETPVPTCVRTGQVRKGGLATTVSMSCQPSLVPAVAPPERE